MPPPTPLPHIISPITFFSAFKSCHSSIDVCKREKSKIFRFEAYFVFNSMGIGINRPKRTSPLQKSLFKFSAEITSSSSIFEYSTTTIASVRCPREGTLAAFGVMATPDSAHIREQPVADLIARV